MVPIHIVVPIYNAYTAVEKCLASLSLNNNGNVTLINDASTDVRIIKLLNKYSRENNWELITHKQNVGFVKTANEGLKLNKGHSILLNSDTIVTKHWLQAFNQSIQSNSELGSATAWSNNAEICSFPVFLKNNPIPLKLDELSETIFYNYQPHYPIIPTAVGFCMLITKLAKEKVGYFDEQHFGHGYGEENDYSLRVEKAGLKNILCDNAYVAHIGNESFSDFGIQPDEASMKRLLQKHPNYLMKIQQYIKADPLDNIRNELLQIINQKNSKLLEKNE